MKRLLVSTRKGFLRYTNSASPSASGTESVNWTRESIDFLAQPVTIAMHDPRDGSTYAALNLGHFGVKLHKQGASAGDWEELPVPSYPDRPDDWKEDESLPGSKAPWTNLQIWALEPGGSDEPGVIWAGTIPGGLFRSSDGGASWELMRSLWDHPERLDWLGGGYDHAGIHSICVDPRDSKHVLVGVSCGGIWETLDAGASWNSRCIGLRAEYMPPELQDKASIQDAHRMVQCPGEPDALWIQHHNGIFKSTDGAATWTEISSAGPSTFGFAALVHPDDPGTAWFVPGVKDECRVPPEQKLVVTRTRDGGESFDVLGKGLPDDSFDIVYRHALAIDASGDILAMGSTTGNLWISENQGDEWQLISNHLAPINALVFESED